MSAIKIVVIGSGGVGKSALCVRFVKGMFIEEYDPTIEDTYLKQLDYSNETNEMLEIIDTAGTDQFLAMRNLYLKAGEAFVIVYSIESESSFNVAKGLREDIIDTKQIDDFPIVLCGSKSDLTDKRQVSKSAGQELANSWNAGFVECSAKTDSNILEIFIKAVKLYKKDNKDTEKKRAKCTIL